jgi:heme b synthase
MYLPRLVALETTRACNLDCIHCRVAAGKIDPSEELKTDEVLGLFDRIAERTRPVVILTGGEPLLRHDIFTIARYGSDLGFHMTLAPNGTLLDESTSRRLIDAGVSRISISLDGATAEVHDAFRRMPGAFHAAMQGIEAARRAGLSFQINTSVTAFNIDEVPRVHELARQLGAAAHHVFMLVRVGRGRDLDAEVPPDRQEKLLQWLYERERQGGMHVRATCAPGYYRVVAQRGGIPGRPGHPATHTESFTRGCLAGRGFVFISSTGRVKPCGYFDVECGDVRQGDFWAIWDDSPVFQALRDDEKLKGKCGRCDYKGICGGCRARAYAATGDYLAEEPSCLYEPAEGK